MQPLPIFKRLYYRFLGYLYAFTHVTSTRRVLGLRISSLIKTAAAATTISALILRWGDLPLLLSFLITILIFIIYWLAGRRGYFRFVAGDPPDYALQYGEKLPPDRRIPCVATGVFSLQEWEKGVLLRPANYWQAPRGDHVLMVEHKPGKYLYQFFNVAKMSDLHRGWLLYGSYPKPALAISYESIWGPEFSRLQFSIFGSVDQQVEPKQRTIYLSFGDEESEEAICHNIIADVVRYKSQIAQQIDKT